MLIKHCFLQGKTGEQAYQWLKKCYPGSAPSKSTIKKWMATFKSGNMSIQDGDRTGRTNIVVIQENIDKIHKIVLDDRKVKIREIAAIVKISTGSVWTILNDHLQMKKLSARWVPRSLTLEQKAKRVTYSEECLGILKKNEEDFFHRYVTMDETWVYHYTPDSKRSSAQWLERGEKRPKRPRTQTSAGKVLASVFWDAQGILFIDYLQKGLTLNSDYYMKLLVTLKQVIGEKRPKMQKKKILFHQDNAPCHKSAVTMKKLDDLGYELLPHPPYSPDLAPSDYYLFSNLKLHLQGRRYKSNEEVIDETNAYFEEKDESFFKRGIEMLQGRWSKCVELQGDYVED